MAEGERGEVVGVRQLCGLPWLASLAARPETGRAQGLRLTWWIISLSTSTGRSSRRSGPFAAFSFPLGTLHVASAAGAALTALAGTLASHTGSAVPRVAMACASSGEDESERTGSASEGKGDAVLGVPGMESGEEAMLRCCVAAWWERQGWSAASTLTAVMG